MTQIATVTKSTSPINIQQGRYDRFVKQFREAKRLGNQHTTAAMYTLLDFEKTSICWKTSASMTFDDVILKEGFCTVSRYHAFKRAASQMTRDTIQTLGVESACFIATQPVKVRTKVVAKVDAFRKSHAVGPTLQHTTKVIQELRQKTKSTAPTYSQLREYCDVLKAEILVLGGKVPAFPKKKNTRK
jgi:hypothetical protein